jgi:hypothetical protein
MFYARQEEDLVPVPNWLGPYWLTVVMVMRQNERGGTKGARRIEGAVRGGNQPDPEKGSILRSR